MEESNQERVSLPDKFANFMFKLVNSLVPRKSRNRFYINWIFRITILLLFTMALDLLCNVMLFLSLAVRLKKFEPILILSALVLTIPILFLTWYKMVTYLKTFSGVFSRKFYIPTFLKEVIACIYLLLAIISAVGLLVLSVTHGSLIFLLAGLIITLFFFQLFSILLNQNLLGINFDELTDKVEVLVIPELGIFKSLIFLLLVLELAVIVILIIPFLLAYDLVSLWKVSPADAVHIYRAALWHNVILAGAFLSPTVGYISHQGIVFGWEVIEGLWKHFNEPKNREEQL